MRALGALFLFKNLIYGGGKIIVMITFLVLHCANYSREYAREFAEDEGFEPSMEFPPYHLSKVAH